jgi:hypothetical protein
VQIDVPSLFPAIFLPRTYPEVNIEVSASPKLSITDLKGDGHAVVLVQILVEAFSRMRSESNVVRVGEGEERD